MTNVSVFLAESAEVEPDAVALRCGAESASYSELASTAARLADCLIEGGVRPGDRVAIMLPNGPAYVAVLYGIWYAGGVAVPMSPSQKARAVEYVLTISSSRVLLFASRRAVATAVAAVTAGTQPIGLGKHGIRRLIAGFRGRAEPVSRAAGDAAVVLHTTGTSTVPWWSELTHGDLVGRQTVIARNRSISGRPTSCWGACRSGRDSGWFARCWALCSHRRRWFCCPSSVPIRR